MTWVCVWWRTRVNRSAKPINTAAWSRCYLDILVDIPLPAAAVAAFMVGLVHP